MSFTINLYTNKSDRIVMTKSLTLIKTLTGTLREETSIINPVIIIEASKADIANLNYIKISEFKRSYFINEIKSLRQNVWELQCHVDVLSSFASEIKANEAIIKRQETNWNLYLNDDSIRCYQDPHVVTRSFPVGFNPNSMSYVLLVAGRPVDGWFDDSNTEVEG